MSEETRIIIAGGREFIDYNLMHNEVSKIISAVTNPIIISGTARGADKLGERYAAEHGIDVVKFPANWDAFGKRAGYIRNEEMALYAKDASDILIAFWDGKSRGTNHMISLARKHGLDVYVVMYGEEDKV